MLVTATVAVVGVNVVGLVAYVVACTNWHGVVCKVRGSHRMDMYTHKCACGTTRRGVM